MPLNVLPRLTARGEQVLLGYNSFWFLKESEVGLSSSVKREIFKHDKKVKTKRIIVFTFALFDYFLEKSLLLWYTFSKYNLKRYYEPNKIFPPPSCTDSTKTDGYILSNQFHTRWIATKLQKNWHSKNMKIFHKKYFMHKSYISLVVGWF